MPPSLAGDHSVVVSVLHRAVGSESQVLRQGACAVLEPLPCPAHLHLLTMWSASHTQDMRRFHRLRRHCRRLRLQLHCPPPSLPPSPTPSPPLSSPLPSPSPPLPSPPPLPQPPWPPLLSPLPPAPPPSLLAPPSPIGHRILCCDVHTWRPCVACSTAVRVWVSV